jgi:hypothetical protein
VVGLLPAAGADRGPARCATTGRSRLKALVEALAEQDADRLAVNGVPIEDPDVAALGLRHAAVAISLL